MGTSVPYLPHDRQGWVCSCVLGSKQSKSHPIQGTHYKFFTDGGAIHPRHADARIACWSVVQDVASNDAERKSSLDFAFGPEPCFPAFRSLAIGLVPGDQVVSRARLFAIRTALLSVHSHDAEATAEFVTDASSVCNIIRAIETGMWLLISHKIPSLDTICEIAHVWDKEKYKVTK